MTLFVRRRYHLILLVMFSLTLMAVVTTTEADESYQRVKVLAPFLELHTAPGRGYPIFHIVKRDEWVSILKRKTDWFKVRTADGLEGWAPRGALALTATESGDRKTFRDQLQADFQNRRVEFGFAAGVFDSDPAMSIRAGLRLTDYFLTELSLTQVSGTFSSSQLFHVNVLMQPFPEWRFSPYFTLGVGQFSNEPKATLVNALDISTTAANAGIGVRTYLSERFFVRADFKNYVATIDDNRNEDYQELLVGLSFFF